MAHESKSAIYVGIAAALLIAATKFAAALFSGSSAMMAEGVHSVVYFGPRTVLVAAAGQLSSSGVSQSVDRAKSITGSHWKRKSTPR